MSQMFKRTIEDFTCEQCGWFVRGDGYTNHCPKCLWSKHVDINPGDRTETCGGLMAPKRLEWEKGEGVIIHCCERCQAVKRVRRAGKDDLGDLASVVLE